MVEKAFKRSKSVRHIRNRNAGLNSDMPQEPQVQVALKRCNAEFMRLREERKIVDSIKTWLIFSWYILLAICLTAILILAS